MAVFTSHISEEASVAAVLRGWITEHFRDHWVYDHTDYSQNAPGIEWTSYLHQKLDEAKVCVVVCSPRSTGRPWINYEVGYAWGREKTVLPICLPSLPAADLRPPLSRVNALEVDENFQMRFLRAISKELTGVSEFSTTYDQSDFTREHRRLLEAITSDGKGPEPPADAALSASPGWSWRELAKIVRRRPYPVLLCAITLTLGGWYLYRPGNCDAVSSDVFPQLGCAQVIENKSNGVMRHGATPCHHDCFQEVTNAVRLESNLQRDGFGVLLFKKADADKPLDVSTLIARVRIEQGSTRFEVAVKDRGSNVAFLHCDAPSTNKAYDYLLRFPTEELERAACKMVPQEASQFSIGFSAGSGSGIGDHVMQVLGIKAVAAAAHVDQATQLVHCNLVPCVRASARLPSP